MIPAWLLFLVVAELFIIAALFLLDTWKWRVGAFIVLSLWALALTAPMIPGFVRFGG